MTPQSIEGAPYRKPRPFAALATAGILLAGATAAQALNYTLEQITVSAAASDPGLVIQHAVKPTPITSMDLNDGESFTFAAFDIWTNEAAVNSDDRTPQTISASFQFSNPVGFGTTIGGETVGLSTIFGVLQYGMVTWTNPAPFTVADRTFSLTLSDEIFNLGIFGLSGGQRHGATVDVTLTQISSTTAVPDGGATLALLGLAMVGLFGVGKIQSRRVRAS